MVPWCKAVARLIGAFCIVSNVLLMLSYGPHHKQNGVLCGGGAVPVLACCVMRCRRACAAAQVEPISSNRQAHAVALHLKHQALASQARSALNAEARQTLIAPPSPGRDGLRIEQGDRPMEPSSTRQAAQASAWHGWSAHFHRD